VLDHRCHEGVVDLVPRFKDLERLSGFRIEIQLGDIRSERGFLLVRLTGRETGRLGDEVEVADDVFEVAEKSQGALLCTRERDTVWTRSTGMMWTYWSVTGCVNPGIVNDGQPPKYSANISIVDVWTCRSNTSILTDEYLFCGRGQRDDAPGCHHCRDSPLIVADMRTT
jgi:hypothetical protein